MKIRKVEIEAFRAYKSKSDGTFDFTNSDGDLSNFVAIYGPNGFGKSSFYDAVEWAITNNLDRLGGDYNKQNFKNAADSTKENGVGQAILRNKYVAKEVITKVSVSTTLPIKFERELPKLRANGRDLRIGNISQRENYFFRRVILSQDEIDRFLRESKPQERYSKFMESFGGNAEVVRKKISILLKENSAECDSLNKRLKELNREIDKTLDSSLFESFNNLAEKLNATSENITLLNECFSSKDEHQLKAHLTTRLHEINSSIKINIEQSEALVELLSKLPEIEKYRHLLKEEKTKLVLTVKALSNLTKYQSLDNLLEQNLEEHKATCARHAHINKLLSIVPDFLEIESNIMVLKDKIKKLTAKKIAYSSELEYLNKKLVETDHEFKTINDTVLHVRGSLDNANVNYQEIATFKNRLVVLLKEMTIKENNIKVDSSEVERLRQIYNEVSIISIDSSFLLSGNTGSLHIDKYKLDALVNLQTDLSLIENNRKKLHATQSAINDQLNLRERLISLGLEYLSIKPTNTCPLCTSVHSSEEELSSKIKQQDLLSEVARENSEELSRLALRQKEINNNIQDVIKDVINAQSKQISNLLEAINKIQSRLNVSYREVTSMKSERKIIQGKITELEQALRGLSYNEFILYAKSELSQYLEKRQYTTKKRHKLYSKIEELSRVINDVDIDLNKHTSEQERKIGYEAYDLLAKYKDYHNITSKELTQHLESVLIKDNQLIQKAVSEQEQLVDSCRILKEEMKYNETWLSFEKLQSRKENLDTSISHNESKINLFCENLLNLANINGEEDLEKVRKKLREKVNNNRASVKELNKLKDGMLLLLELAKSFEPYLKNLSTQTEIESLKQQLKQHNNVSEALTIEHAKVISHLQTFINNFFYEDLINSIYKKIDPHPTFKKVEFKPDFSNDKPGLNIVVSNEDGDVISPILYFSAAQATILSLSVFLASALHAKDDNNDPVDVILIDDPIQAMDSINILSTIDLLRSICLQFDKQLIISTHDENFFGLLQRKIPVEIFNSKFLQLEKFGKVVPVEPFYN